MKHIQLFEDFVNEGLFDFLKSDVIDFTKEDKPKKKSRLLKFLNNDEEEHDFSGGIGRKPKSSKPNINPAHQRPYYGVQEEEEEEQPYKKVVSRNSNRKDDYWSDENVRLREARKRKNTRTTK